MGKAYRIFVSGRYAGYEFAEDEDSAVTQYLAHPGRPVAIDSVAAEFAPDLPVTRYEVELTIGDRSGRVEVEATCEPEAEARALALAGLDGPDAPPAEARVLAIVSSDPLPGRVVPFPGHALP